MPLSVGIHKVAVMHCCLPCTMRQLSCTAYQSLLRTGRQRRCTTPSFAPPPYRKVPSRAPGGPPPAAPATATLRPPLPLPQPPWPNAPACRILPLNGGGGAAQQRSHRHPHIWQHTHWHQWHLQLRNGSPTVHLHRRTSILRLSCVYQRPPQQISLAPPRFTPRPAPPGAVQGAHPAASAPLRQAPAWPAVTASWQRQRHIPRSLPQLAAAQPRQRRPRRLLRRLRLNTAGASCGPRPQMRSHPWSSTRLGRVDMRAAAAWERLLASPLQALCSRSAWVTAPTMCSRVPWYGNAGTCQLQ